MHEWFYIFIAIMGQIFAAGAVYGAIKGDIKALIQTTSENRESIKKSHERIDDILMRRDK